MIEDKRTAAEKKTTIGFVVAIDDFLSGWGHAEHGVSFYVLPFRSDGERIHLRGRVSEREEMRIQADRGPRFVRGLISEHRQCDHYSIASPSDARWFYPEAIDVT